tara:strand:- start:1849 stop:2031 length:183 start_codon:yes stop_codon:yes gene_type:complete
MRRNKMSSNHNDSGITILSMIEIYKKLIDAGKIKKGSAGYQRMNQLKLKYSKGERYFQKC